jgi:hypothetical protein
MPKKIEVVEMPADLAFSEHTENVNKVPNRAWRKWNNQARYIFNNVFNQMQDQTVMKHPKADLMGPEHWQTLRWNAAWLAAEAAMATVKDGPTLEDAATQVFVPMLQALYAKAGLSVPAKVYPGREVKRLVAALRKGGQE